MKAHNTLSIIKKHKYSPHSRFRQLFYCSLRIVVLLIMLSASLVGQQHGLIVETNAILGGDGIKIPYAHSDGVQIDSARYFGFYVVSSGEAGLFVEQAGTIGVQINSAEAEGIYINTAGTFGLFLGSAEDDGIFVGRAGNNGVHVITAESDGIYVDGAGGFSMNIQGNKNSGEAHIAQIRNRSTSNNGDVLRLQIDRDPGSPGNSNNFLTFYHGDDTKIGEIDGNGSGGVRYLSSGSDFAEYLPVMEKNTRYYPGDVVGVYDGFISHNTKGAAQVMVVTDQAAVVGNMPEEEHIGDYRSVSFIGQIPVRIEGPVLSGDWIVPDGNNNGIAIAVPAAELTIEHQIVGQAWESSFEPGVKRVNTVVGLDRSAALMHIFRIQQQQIDQQKGINASLQAQIDELKKLITTAMGN